MFVLVIAVAIAVAVFGVDAAVNVVVAVIEVVGLTCLFTVVFLVICVFRKHKKTKQ